jgi:hypothetical protein
LIYSTAGFGSADFCFGTDLTPAIAAKGFPMASGFEKSAVERGNPVPLAVRLLYLTGVSP